VRFLNGLKIIEMIVEELEIFEWIEDKDWLIDRIFELCLMSKTLI
jgi:hypothetical protein